MGFFEIILIIIGGLIFVLSFIIPDKNNKNSDTNTEVTKQEIEKMVTNQIDNAKSQIHDVVNETIDYTMEKTERSLERLSNEKIMAVNEYSDTVLKEIHKNHEEVMFLYDMLNDKHKNLQNTVSEATKTVKEVDESKKRAEEVVSSFQNLSGIAKESVVDEVISIKEDNKLQTENEKAKTKVKTSRKKADAVQSDMERTVDSFDKTVSRDLTSLIPSDVIIDEAEESINSNDKILELHKQGKSNVSIAKELGLGVGEVKLVIDLYKNMK